MTTQTILTSTLCKVQETNKGVKSYVVYANEFGGVDLTSENGIEVKRFKMGKVIELYRTNDISTATKLIKNFKKVGKLAQVNL